MGYVGVGWVMQALCGVNLNIPQSIKSDRTIMEVQGIESLTPKYENIENIKLLVLQGI